MKIQKIIKTRRLILRPPLLSDAKKIFQGYAQDLEVTRYVSWKMHQSLQETESFIKTCVEAWKTDVQYPWVVVTSKENRVIGMIELRFEKSNKLAHMADVGYVLARSEWGRGYATEALNAVMKYAFSFPKVCRVWAVCDVDNPASARVMKKAGMVREGRMRQYTFHPNIGPEPCDVYLYAKVR